MPLTQDQPKCFAPIGGKRILDWILESLAAGGFSGQDVVFVGGYLLPEIQREYPQLTYVENAAWERNNILASLFCAEPHMRDGFVCSYADILYRPFAVERVMASPHAATLVVDTHFRARYQHRSLHPESDAEKVRCEGERVVEISRRIPAAAAAGEYIGVARFTPAGAAQLRQHYHRALLECGPDTAFQGAATFRMAYFIHLLQDMLEHGVALHRVDTPGEYHEIDTIQDYALAMEQWR